MPGSKYISVLIDNQQVDISDPEDIIALSYKFEDRDNFQAKQSSQLLGLTVPATINNDKIGNTFHNPAIEDMADGQAFREPRKCIIRAGGMELLTGKAFLKAGKHTNKPTSYNHDLYGNNGDWIIDLKESTLYDFLQHITFLFTKQNIISSWQYDGLNELLPYAFIPIRYGQPMDTLTSFVDGVETGDYNMYPEYMKPSISKYWLIYWGFKSLGYRVQSDFFNLPYFRRQLMPWTWGAFLDTDGTKLDVLKFLAKSIEMTHKLNEDFTGFWDLGVYNESTNGAFDNGNVYSYDGIEMTWTYPVTATFGTLRAFLHLQIFVDAVATANSEVELRVQWFKNGTKFNHGSDNGNGTLLVDLDAPAIGRREFAGIIDDYADNLINPGDTISAKIYLHTQKTSAGIARIHASVDAFEIAYFRIPLGGTINFSNYLGLKQFKFLDFLGGVIDEFNLTVQTDPVNKVVYMEPQHPYSVTNDLSSPAGGYFNGNFIDWSDKQDLSKESTMELFSDSERELLFKYKDDGNDGGLKKTQDRNSNTLALAKYVFPNRFKAGKREIENRFFSPTMHYEPSQWQFNNIEPPQMILMQPENISNVSAGEAQNTLTPKSIYYKGLTTQWKWVFDKQITHPYPFAFAVNYKPGGENDPILSYADENCGTDDAPIIGKGLLRRFYLQRLAIMRNGQYYITWFRLNNNDVANFLHREHIILQGQKWELAEINNYKPLKEESTQVFLKKWSPITNA